MGQLYWIDVPIKSYWGFMHPAYQDLVVNHAFRLVNAAQAVQKVQHSGLRGTLREIVARELLLPLLPPHFLIGNGEIISSYNQTSNQIDLVIADRRNLPAMLIDAASGVFPIETVLASIEVKSTLTRAELKKADASAATIAQFAHAPPVGGERTLPQLCM